MRGAAIALAAAVAGLVALPAHASDASVEQALLRGVSEIRTGHGAQVLERRLGRTLVRLRQDRASTAVGRKARLLAIEGFASTLAGVRTQLALVADDSGNIEAAVRHARRAYRYLDRGARLLRAAGRAFGLRIGKLNGH